MSSWSDSNTLSRPSKPSMRQRARTSSSQPFHKMPIRPTTLRSEGGSLVEEESAWSFPFFSSFVDPSLELGAGYPEYFAVDCDLEDCSRDGMGSGSLITC